jgi:hypothetical protein
VNHGQAKRATSAVRPTLLLTAGAAGAVIARRLLVRALLFKFRRDIAALNTGIYQPVLSSYAEDAVLNLTMARTVGLANTVASPLSQAS